MFLGNKTSRKSFVLQRDQPLTHSFEVLQHPPAHEWEVFLYLGPDPGVGDHGETGLKDELGGMGLLSSHCPAHRTAWKATCSRCLIAADGSWP